MFSKFRKSAAITLASVVALSTLLSASAASTTKNLSSNFTLVNLVSGTNNGNITYVKPDGSEWRPAESFSFAALGDQLAKRQYFDDQLTPGSGSVVVSTDGPVGAVVQIQARSPQVPTFGAYIGVSEGATEASVPLVMRKLNTASGLGNSQIIVQNASSTAINVEIALVESSTGNTTFTKAITNLAANASFEYDLEEESTSNLPDGWFGSAIVKSTTAGGEVAVVSNLFSGAHAMQTFNAFTTTKTKWGVPLFASRLANSLSTPIAVQNKSGGSIPIDGVTVTCLKGNGSPDPATLTAKNTAAIGNGATYFFNPVTNNTDFPDGWFGACNVDAGAFQTAVFVQMRVVSGDRAGAYEGIALDGTNKRVVIPLYAKRLVNGFASNVTVLNLSTSAIANVSLVYKGDPTLPANCSATLNRSIPAGGSLLQNHRLESGAPNAVDELGDNCFGTLTVTSSDQPVDAFVQLDLLDTILEPDPGGDPFQAHNTFTLATTN